MKGKAVESLISDGIKSLEIWARGTNQPLRPRAISTAPYPDFR